MSARDKLYAYAGTPSVLPESMLDAALDAYRAEVLAEAADRLALELTPEQPGAGPGFLLALRLSMRALRRMADNPPAPAATYAGTRGEPGAVDQ
jgi:hypothetical protein